MVARGDSEQAERFSATRWIRERLAQADPSDAGAQRDLSISYERLGDVTVARGESEQAERFYGDALRIVQETLEPDSTEARALEDSIRRINATP